MPASRYGGSQRMATDLAWRCMRNITPHTDTATDESEVNSLVPAKRLYSAPRQQMLFSCGESSSTTALTSEPASDSRESTAPRSETTTAKRTRAASLSDRLTPLLISAGLVKGITPTSIRRQLGATIPAFVSSLPDGHQFGTPLENEF